MDGEVVIVDVPDDLRDEVEKDPFGDLFVGDGILEVLPNHSVIRLQDLDQFQNHREHLLAFLVVEG